MIEYESLHDTRYQAEQAGLAYKTGYPPEGYGTQIHICQMTNGQWRMSAKRWHSCD